MFKIKNLVYATRAKSEKLDKLGLKSRRKKSKKDKIILFVKFIIPVVIIFVLVFIFLQSQVFRVVNIECKTQYSLCSDQDQEVLSSFEGKNLISIKNSEVEAKITKSFANRRIIVQKVFPGTLSVFLERRKPTVALVQTTIGDGMFLVDNDGVIIEFAKSASLPIISFIPNSPLVVGGKVDSDILQAVKLMQLIYKSQKVINGNLHDGALETRLSSGIIVTLPLDRDPQVLVGALQLITARIKIDGKVPKSIDLRYSNPVLSY